MTAKPENLVNQSELQSENIFAACADVERSRLWVEQEWKIDSCDAGNFWLPVVLTARGPLYAEVITIKADGKYHQPVHLSDRTKQPLYYLAHNLLNYFSASPAVYLLQFGLEDNETGQPKILFDRLIPFPDKPAIASVGVQEPDLFACHLMCVNHSPIYDLIIKNPD